MANTNPVISDEADAVAVNERVRGIGLVESFQAVSLTRNFDGRDTSALPILDCSLGPVATEDGKEVASAAVMLDAMKGCAKSGVIVSCHCEDPELALAAKPFRASALAALREGRTSDARADLAEAERLLRLAEDTMTNRNLSLAEAAGCRVHIAHVSTSGSLDAVRRAKALAGAAVTCEATPHHLSLTGERLELVNPPLRSAADREALIAGLLDGTIDAIATDHAPHTAEDKASGAPGFSGIEIAFATCLTSLVKTGRLSLQKLSALMSANPAAILGLRRGLIASGYDADFALVDVGSEFTVDTSPDSGGGNWHSKGTYTPLADTRLNGKILATFKRGRIVYEAGDGNPIFC
jgi:dihydroorotase